MGIASDRFNNLPEVVQMILYDMFTIDELFQRFSKSDFIYSIDKLNFLDGDDIEIIYQDQEKIYYYVK